ncbi:g2088 [Coccomyxa elongata]
MSVCPYLFYNNAKAAKHWMFDICGFKPGILKENEDGSIMHAEAHHGSSIIMFCAPNRPEMKKNAVNPAARPTVYVSVKDVDGLHQRAKAAGATFVKNPFDTEWGSRDFHMKDPEGRVWFFGTYSPCMRMKPPEGSKE